MEDVDSIHAHTPPARPPSIWMITSGLIMMFLILVASYAQLWFTVTQGLVTQSAREAVERIDQTSQKIEQTLQQLERTEQAVEDTRDAIGQTKQTTDAIKRDVEVLKEQQEGANSGREP